MGLLSPWCPPFTNVQVTASRIYEHHDSEEQRGGRLHRCSMMPHQESAPSIYVYIWFPSVLRVTNVLNLLTAPPDCRERREKGLGAESIRDKSMKA